jgi:hypothetical protein
VSVLDKSWSRTREINVPRSAAPKALDTLRAHGFKADLVVLFEENPVRADAWQKIRFDGPPWLFIAVHLCFNTAKAMEFGELLLEAILEDKEAFETIVRLAPDEASWKRSIRLVVSERLERAEAELLEWLKR